ncbi:MAG: hypothetical protein U5L03_16025 [Burkholderiaceae bacterium]|nr:hypothetical protein [Burkholderiaceae bacterium]
MGLFDSLFDRMRGKSESADEPVLKEALDRAVEVVDPRLKLLPRYADRLRPALMASIQHLRSVLNGIGVVHEASAEAWGGDPLIRAVFPRPADVAAIISRAREVQKYFRTNPAANEVFGVVGMAFEEKHVMAPALQDGVVRQDVMRTQLSFSDHKVALVGPDLDALRRVIGRAMFNQLLLNAVEQLSAQERQRKDLGMARAMLQARLRMLKGQETTLAAAFDEAAAVDPAAQINALEQELARTSGAIGDLGGGVDALDKELEALANLLLHTGDALQLSERTLRIDQFNTVVEPALAEGAEIQFVVLRIASAPPRTRAAVFIRFERAHLGRGGLAIDEVARGL